MINKRIPPPEILPLEGVTNIFGYVDDASHVNYNKKSRYVEIRNSRKHPCWSLLPECIAKMQRISPHEFVVFHSECPAGFRDVTVFHFPKRIESEYAYHEIKEIVKERSTTSNKEVLT